MYTILFWVDTAMGITAHVSTNDKQEAEKLENCLDIAAVYYNGRLIRTYVN